jgi:hypothetical protein
MIHILVYERWCIGEGPGLKTFPNMKFYNFLKYYLASFGFFFLSKIPLIYVCPSCPFLFAPSLFVSIYFLCVFLFSLFFLSSSLCKHAHIFIYFCYPLLLANLSFQNIFINLLSFRVSLVIQTFKTFLFFSILLSFLLI